MKVRHFAFSAILSHSPGLLFRLHGFEELKGYPDIHVVGIKIPEPVGCTFQPHALSPRDASPHFPSAVDPTSKLRGCYLQAPAQVSCSIATAPRNDDLAPCT
jgi:hypothetical protein